MATAQFPGTLVIQPDAQNALTKPSVALVFQTRALDQRYALHRMGEIDSTTLTQVVALLQALTS
jgi:hypothetical protein